MGKIITVCSGKGGTGKTTTVAAISSCLAALGYKTLCIDFDSGMGNLDLSLAMSDFSVMDYADVISGATPLETAYSRSPHIPGLYFLSAPSAGELKDSSRESIIAMLESVRNIFDFCIIDAPSGVGTGFLLAHCSSDISIIVTTGELPAMRDATRAAEVLRKNGIFNIRLLVNKVNPSNLAQIRTTIDDIIDTTGVQLIGLISEDKYVTAALHDCVPLILYDKRRAANGFLDAARRIRGEELRLKVY